MLTPSYRFFIIMMSALLVACSSLDLPDFDQTSLNNAERLKTSSLNLIAKSSGLGSAADNQLEINLLADQIRRARAHAEAINNNDEAISNWQDIENEVIGPFLEYWQESGNIQPAARDEFAVQVTEAYDTIICIERNKRAPTQCPALATPDR